MFVCNPKNGIKLKHMFEPDSMDYSVQAMLIGGLKSKFNPKISSKPLIWVIDAGVKRLQKTGVLWSKGYPKMLGYIIFSNT